MNGASVLGKHEGRADAGGTAMNGVRRMSHGSPTVPATGHAPSPAPNVPESFSMQPTAATFPTFQFPVMPGVQNVTPVAAFPRATTGYFPAEPVRPPPVQPPCVGFAAGRTGGEKTAATHVRRKGKVVAGRSKVPGTTNGIADRAPSTTDRQQNPPLDVVLESWKPFSAEDTGGHRAMPNLVAPPPTFSFGATAPPRERFADSPTAATMTAPGSSQGAHQGPEVKLSPKRPASVEPAHTDDSSCATRDLDLEAPAGSRVPPPSPSHSPGPRTTPSMQADAPAPNVQPQTARAAEGNAARQPGGPSHPTTAFPGFTFGAGFQGPTTNPPGLFYYAPSVMPSNAAAGPGMPAGATPLAPCFVFWPPNLGKDQGAAPGWAPQAPLWPPRQAGADAAAGKADAGGASGASSQPQPAVPSDIPTSFSGTASASSTRSSTQPLNPHPLSSHPAPAPAASSIPLAPGTTSSVPPGVAFGAGLSMAPGRGPPAGTASAHPPKKTSRVPKKAGVHPKRPTSGGGGSGSSTNPFVGSQRYATTAAAGATAIAGDGRQQGLSGEQAAAVSSSSSPSFMDISPPCTPPEASGGRPPPVAPSFPFSVASALSGGSGRSTSATTTAPPLSSAATSSAQAGTATTAAAAGATAAAAAAGAAAMLTSSTGTATTAQAAPAPSTANGWFATGGVAPSAGAGATAGSMPFVATHAAAPPSFSTPVFRAGISRPASAPAPTFTPPPASTFPPPAANFPPPPPIFPPPPAFFAVPGFSPSSAPTFAAGFAKLATAWSADAGTRGSGSATGSVAGQEPAAAQDNPLPGFVGLSLGRSSPPPPGAKSKSAMHRGARRGARASGGVGDGARRKPPAPGAASTAEQGLQDPLLRQSSQQQQPPQQPKDGPHAATSVSSEPAVPSVSSSREADILAENTARLNLGDPARGSGAASRGPGSISQEDTRQTTPTFTAAVGQGLGHGQGQAQAQGRMRANGSWKVLGRTGGAKSAPAPAMMSPGSKGVLQAGVSPVGVGGAAPQRPASAGAPHGLGGQGSRPKLGDTIRQQARNAYSQKQYSEASDLFLRAVGHLREEGADASELALCHSNRAAALVMLNKPAHALQECRQALRNDPDCLRAMLRAGKCLLLMGQIAEAQAELCACLARVDAPTLSLRSIDLQGLRREVEECRESCGVLARLTAEAEPLLASVAGGAGSSPGGRVGGSAAATRGNAAGEDGFEALVAARDKVERALKLAPHWKRLERLKGRALIKIGHYREAAEYVHECFLSTRSEGLTVFAQRLEAMVRGTSVGGAVLASSAAATRDTHGAHLLLLKSLANFHQGHMEGTVIAAHECRSHILQDGSAGPRFVKGLSGRWEPVVVAAAAAATGGAANGAAAGAGGGAAGTNGGGGSSNGNGAAAPADGGREAQEEVELLHACDELEETVSKMLAHKAAGNRAFSSGEYDKAIACYNDALACDSRPRPFNAIVYCNRAAAEQALGLIADAIADCTLATVLDPTYAKALSRRADLHEKLRDYSEVVLDLEAWKQLEGGKGAAGRGHSFGRGRAGASSTPEIDKRLKDARKRVARGGKISYYDVLGLTSSASKSEIKRAYHRLALRHHPDKAMSFLVGGDSGEHYDAKLVAGAKSEAERLFKYIQEAYSVLHDIDKRAEYDMEESGIKMGWGRDMNFYSRGWGYY
eukprot:jgi/Mesvir1/24394/Mv11062-RA.1